MQAKVLYRTFLKVILSIGILLGLSFFYVANAYSSPGALPWVIDEQDLFPLSQSSGITHVLASSAMNRDIHVRVVLVNVPAENAKELINQKVVEYKNRIPHSMKEKTNFLVINLRTNESRILLGNEIQRTAPLIESLVRIQNDIVLPSLSQGDIKAAVSQGAVAIATVLDTSPVIHNTSSLWHAFKAWLSSYYLWTPMQIFFWLGVFFALAYVLFKFFDKPSKNPEEVDMIALQETIIENSLMLRQQYGHYSDPHGY